MDKSFIQMSVCRRLRPKQEIEMKELATQLQINNYSLMLMD